MNRETVRPNDWVALKLPNDTLRILQMIPNATVSLGKYGVFPTNLILERPYHLTYEVQDKLEGENFARLRIVPAKELNAEMMSDPTNEPAESDEVIEAADGEEMTLVDDNGEVVVRSNREIIDDSARQTLTAEEIEELKKKGSSAGKDIIAKLLLSHTAIDQKTAYSLAKYKLLKTKKYIRRFQVLPLDVPQLSQWLIDDRDPSKIMEMRQEMMALIGCWADVHFSAGVPSSEEDGSNRSQSGGKRWLVVDDTGGLLVAALAERMGILHQPDQEEDESEDQRPGKMPKQENGGEEAETQEPSKDVPTEAQAEAPAEAQTANQQVEGTNEQSTGTLLSHRNHKKRPRRSDFDVPYASSNTITLLHSNTQPNLVLLNYYNYDSCNPNPPYPYHPFVTNVMPITWLQLLAPEEDEAYSSQPPEATPEEIMSWKTNRRGNYHRKRRRWARTRHIVDTTRQGGFSGLAVASTMDPISIVKQAIPLLAGGAPIAIYSASVEPLTQLANCFSVARRAAWVTNPPVEAEGKSIEELERWPGNDEFPLNPTMLLGVSIQTSRARRWQVLPGRTHPFMMGRGGAEGYLLTAWRAIPVEGRIEARGKFNKKKGE